MGSWCDPTGSPPHVGRDAIAERIKNLPPMDSATVSDIFFTVSDKIFLVKVEMQFTGKDHPFTIVDRVVLNDDNKITQLQAYFHPSAVVAKGGKPDYAPAIEEFCKVYAEALFKHEPLLDLFAEEG